MKQGREKTARKYNGNFGKFRTQEENAMDPLYNWEENVSETVIQLRENIAESWHEVFRTRREGKFSLKKRILEKGTFHSRKTGNDRFVSYLKRKPFAPRKNRIFGTKTFEIFNTETFDVFATKNVEIFITKIIEIYGVKTFMTFSKKTFVTSGIVTSTGINSLRHSVLSSLS